MEYERIHKPQSVGNNGGGGGGGMISPSKLRMKLIGGGSQNQKKKKDGGSNCNNNNSSSRTASPNSRLDDDSDFINNSLLASAESLDDSGHLHDDYQVSSLEVGPTKSDNSTTSDAATTQIDENPIKSKDNADTARFRMQLVSKGGDNNNNSSSVHPVRTYEDENLDYDSTSSFEFHKGERTLHHSVSRPYSRPVPSKWNDAEKWIMNRQNSQSNGVSKKSNLQCQPNRPLVAGSNVVRVVPESTSLDSKTSVKRVDFVQPAGPGRFGFGGLNGLVDLCPESKDLSEVDGSGLPCTKSVTEETTGVPGIRSVSMRDMGTEMTPIPSQEPSRSVTPVSSTTPLRSPTSSMPSTPRRGDPAPTPTDFPIVSPTENGRKDLSEQEMKLKTRREIVALGVQLGKMNIAAWASKDEKEKGNSGNGGVDVDELDQIEYAKRAAAWEEAEKSKHAARFKREEIRIQAWESQQKAKLEAEMRKIEAQIEQMKAHAQAKMVKKIAMARQKSDEKRAAAEAKKNKQAEKTAVQAECIRQTGRIPSSPFICCGWS